MGTQTSSWKIPTRRCSFFIWHESLTHPWTSFWILQNVAITLHGRKLPKVWKRTTKRKLYESNFAQKIGKIDKILFISSWGKRKFVFGKQEEQENDQCLFNWAHGQKQRLSWNWIETLQSEMCGNVFNVWRQILQSFDRCTNRTSRQESTFCSPDWPTICASSRKNGIHFAIPSANPLFPNRCSKFSIVAVTASHEQTWRHLGQAVWGKIPNQIVPISSNSTSASSIPDR